jgi:hypothetical protein
MKARLLIAAACVALSACTAPYSPPVVAKTSAEFSKRGLKAALTQAG